MRCLETLDKFGKFTGILLFVLSIICFFSDPPIVTIVFSLIIIAGAITCLVRKHRLKGFFIVAIIIAVFTLWAAIGQTDEYGLFNKYPDEIADPVDRVDYSDMNNWAYYGLGDDKDADLFLICPTVDMNDEYNMSMDDEETKASFLGALNMERGIYEDSTRMYAPYYRHAAMKVYSLSPEEREPYLQYAYEDVSAAFEYYLTSENQGRPIILAGFSQGADMCYRLLEEYFGEDDLYNRLVAVYAIGWPCTKELVEKYPQIKPATSADDIGVVISFDCEASDVEETFIYPVGVNAYTINPLSWKTDSSPAEKSLNLGACFTDYSGNITNEVKGLCGCYIDEGRGVIKVTDIDPAAYPAYLTILPEGAYHIYDYQFFYRNLQENVKNRISLFKK